MAIALDAATSGGVSSGVTSKTFAHTCTGSDLILFVGAFGSTTDVLTGTTYAGNAMTLLAKDENGDRWAYLWYLVAPTTGANNVVISASASGAIFGGAVSYTGAAQTGVPDALKVEETSPTTTITTVADNCWVVSVFRGVSGGVAAGTGLTLRVNGGANGFCMFDRNGPQTPAGTTSNMTVNNPGTNYVWILASFAPATGGGGGTRPVKMVGRWGGFAGESGGFVA